MIKIINLSKQPEIALDAKTKLENNYSSKNIISTVGFFSTIIFIFL